MDSSAKISGWRWGLCATAMVLAGQLWLLRDFGTALPYQDQWKCTAVEILEPWLAGRLTPGSFFQHHNDHMNAVGRITSFLLVQAGGQWNNLAEAILSAVVWAGAIFVIVATLTPYIGRLASAWFTLFAGFVCAMPYSWENTLFGIQINVTAEILLALVCLRAAAFAPAFSPAWWIGQLCGAMTLLTQRSGMLVFPALMLLGLAQWASDRPARRGAIPTLGCAAGGMLLFWCITPPLETTALMKAASWRLFVDALFRQLGWPLTHPGWMLALYLPVLAVAIRAGLRRRLPPPEAFLLAVAAWVVAHAAAVGYARAEVTTGFVSRYTNYLAIGVLANGACIALLAQEFRTRTARRAAVMLAFLWLAAVAWGVRAESVSGHAGYNLERRPTVNRTHGDAVAAFIQQGDARKLESPAMQVSFYPHTPTITRLLSDPRFRALLPPESGAREARQDHGRLTLLIRGALAPGPWLFAAAAVTAAGFALRRHPRQIPRGNDGPDRITPTWVRATLGAALSIPLGGLAVAWDQPWSYTAPARWSGLIASAGAGSLVEIPDFTATVGPPVDGRQLQGAVMMDPPQFTPYFRGTLVDGSTAYRGVLASNEFVIERRYLVALLAGWPNWPGNAVRWQVENPATGESLWLPALGQPNGPGGRPRLWVADLERQRGWRTRLHLFDGNTDEHGWVGISPVIATDDDQLGARWSASMDAERAESSHAVMTALAGLAVLLTTAWTLAGIRRV